MNMLEPEYPAIEVLIHRHARKITYPQFSKTEHCNLHCNFSTSKYGVEFLGHNEIISHKKIIDICDIFVTCRIRKTRLTHREQLDV